MNTLATFFAADPSGGLPVPAWLEKVTVVGLIVFFGLALARNWLYTGGQVEKLLEAERRVSELWKQNAETSQGNLERLVEVVEPVVAGNAAILRAVEEIQREQLAQRYQRKETDREGR